MSLPSAAPASPASSLRTVLLAGFVTLVACLLTASGHLFSPDEEIQFRTTESLADGRGGAIRFTPGEPIAGFATRPGRGGAEFAQYGLGQPLVALPFHGLGRLLAAIIPDAALPGLFPATTQYHDGSPAAWKVRLGPSFLNSFVTAATAALLAAALAGWGLGRREALLAAIAFALGSYAWAHARTFFSEPLAALLVFAAFVLLAAWHRGGCARPLLPLAAGALAGFGFLVRKDTPFFYPGLVLHAAAPLWLGAVAGREAAAACLPAAPRRAVLAGVALHLAAIIAFMVLHLGLSWWMFGSFLALGYEDQPEGIEFGAPLYSGIYGFLFSYGRGLLWFSPGLLPALLAWPRLWRRRPDLAAGAALVVLPFFLMMCRWQNWAGGWCWGPRHVYQVHIFLALGFLAFLGPAGWGGDSDRPPAASRARRGLAWAGIAAGFLLAAPGATLAVGAGSTLGVIAATVAGSILLVAGLGGLLGGGEATGVTAVAEPPSADRRVVAILFLCIGAAVQLYGSSQNFIDYYTLFFRRPDLPPTSRLLYTPGEAAGVEVTLARPDGRRTSPAPLALTRVPAPINDSIYVPQNSAWYGFAAMWREGYHDLLWLRLLGRPSGPEPGPATELGRPPMGR